MTGGCYRCAGGGCPTHPGDTHELRDGTVSYASFERSARVESILDSYSRLDGKEIFSEVAVAPELYRKLVEVCRFIEMDPGAFTSISRIMLSSLLVIQDPHMPEDVVWFRNPLMKVDRIVKLGAA